MKKYFILILFESYKYWKLSGILFILTILLIIYKVCISIIAIDQPPRGRSLFSRLIQKLNESYVELQSCGYKINFKWKSKCLYAYFKKILNKEIEIFSTFSKSLIWELKVYEKINEKFFHRYSCIFKLN